VTLADAVLVLLWLALTAYALLGGADFGGGFWDLVAGGPERGARQRALIEHSIGPVWEANHVWLIFFLVVMWTAFPQVFAAIASTLYLPLMAAALGIILRGSGFAFRKTVQEVSLKRVFGGAFALSSVITPFFIGAAAGGVASGRVPLGNAAGNLVTSWLNPTSVLAGVLATGVCAYLAAVYLTGDAVREGAIDLAESFRRRGMAAGLIVGAIALGGIAVLHADAPRLFHGLTRRGLPLVVASAVFGMASLVLLWKRRYGLVRVTAALAVVSVVWGWGVAQYPLMLEPNVTIADAAAPAATLRAMLVSLGVGAVLLVPSLVWLFVLFQRGRPARAVADPGGDLRSEAPGSRG
jgi:cytochrome d ubiquinol oxidase subunit II